jgi:hypothetical protein
MATFVAVLATTAIPVGAQEAVFINEIHYENAGTDVGEFVEIAGPAGTDLAGWTVVLYNGIDGTPYDTILLAGVLPDQSLGGGTLFFEQPGIQNGPADGAALVDATNTVIQFLSYEGTVTAVGGPADGMQSVDIGVAEGSSTPVGHSLQLIDPQPGRGHVYSDFVWIGPAIASPGVVNSGQELPVELLSISVD